MSFHVIHTGLALELNVEQDEYIGLLTPEAGIRMDISPQGEMPFPMERGVSLAPGYATMIGLRKVKITGLNSPLSCIVCLKLNIHHRAITVP